MKIKGLYFLLYERKKLLYLKNIYFLLSTFYILEKNYIFFYLPFISEKNCIFFNLPFISKSTTPVVLNQQFIGAFIIFDREYDSRGPRNTKDVPGEHFSKSHRKPLKY